MHKTTDVLRVDLASVRAGRATPALLEKVMVDYYGTPTPVNQVASVTVPEPENDHYPALGEESSEGY